MIPMFFLTMIQRKRPRLFTLYMMVGITVALIASELNAILLGLMDNNVVYTTTVITPVSEELLKLFPILFYAVVFSDEQEVLIPLSLALGVGFATFENITILIQNIDTVTVGWSLIRGFASSLVHGVCAMAVGFGMSFIRKKKKLFASGIFAIFALVCIYHGIFNMLMQSDYRYVSFILPMATYIPFLIYLIRRNRTARVKNAD